MGGAFVACGIYLDKANSDNGSLIVYPGTHWLGDTKYNPNPNFEYGPNSEVLKSNKIGNDCEIPPGYEEYQIDMRGVSNRYEKRGYYFFSRTPNL